MVLRLFGLGKGKMVRDPVCGMEVDERRAPATAEYEGQTYYFCCSHCKAEFERNPEEYVRPAAAAEGA